MTHKLVDSHCHLSYFPKNEIALILSKAQEVGVFKIHTICTKLQELPELVEMTQTYDNVFCSVGVHPCEVTNVITTVEDIEKAVSAFNEKQKVKIISVGEVGIDCYSPESAKNIDNQKEALLAHIEFAVKTKRPLVFHVRNGVEDAEKIFYDVIQFAKNNSNFEGIMHCFTGTKKFMHQMLDVGFFISFSGIVTFKNAQDVQECAKQVPLNYILIETDAPYLAPYPMRGKKNQPAFVKHIAEFMATNIYNVSLEEIATITTNNFNKLFGQPS